MRIQLSSDHIIEDSVDNLEIHDALDPTYIVENTMHQTYSEDQHIIGVYNGFRFKIVKNFMGAYCGYVLVDDHPQIDKINLITEEEDVYEPHGGYTASWGFDCAHYTDIYFNGKKKTDRWIDAHTKPVQTFKTYQFVQSECFKIIDSLNAYLANIQ